MEIEILDEALEQPSDNSWLSVESVVWLSSQLALSWYEPVDDGFQSNEYLLFWSVINTAMVAQPVEPLFRWRIVTFDCDLLGVIDPLTVMLSP